MKQIMLTIIAAASLAAVPGFSATAQLAQSIRQDLTAHRELNMEAVPQLDEAGLRKVQAALQKKGFDPGPVDGVFGPITQEAVRNFQDHFGIKGSGRIDNQTLYALGEVELAGQP